MRLGMRPIDSSAQNEPEDFSLIRAAAKGDRQAFERLIEQHYGMMFKVAFKWCGRREDAEDIAQNTCIKLAKNLNQFQFNAAFTTWLYRIVINTAKDYQRAKQVRSGRESELFEETLNIEGPENQEELLLAKQTMRIVEQLPDKLKSAVILVCCEGLSHKEAAKALECAETTISWRIHEARKRIEKTLKQEGSNNG